MAEKTLKVRARFGFYDGTGKVVPAGSVFDIPERFAAELMSAGKIELADGPASPLSQASIDAASKAAATPAK